MSKAREIRNKISSIKNTQKITRAMELVAASKMRKAQDRMLLSRPYAAKIRKVIAHVAASHPEYPHPYLQQRETIKRVGFIVVSTDRGLCGGLNVNLFRASIANMKQWHEKNIDIDLCVIGRKAEAFFRRFGGNVLAVADRLGDAPEVQNLIGIVKVMLDQFNEGKIDAIYIASNEFINTMIQKPMIRQLLPLQMEKSESQGYWDYIYEPDSAKDLLEKLLVRYVESQVYQGVVENIACEQSARMVAMKNATENAGKLIDELQLIYNKARQAGITREIAEIVAGAAAVE
jgi:F-type H+-transporting ATPase subunit gamma